VVLLLVLIDIFARCYDRNAIRANIDWKSAFIKGVGQFRPNFHVVVDVPRELFLHG